MKRLSTVATALAMTLMMAGSPLAMPEPELEPVAYPDEPTAPEMAQTRDAAVDRGILTSHADTIGAGNWSFNNYQLLLVGLTHAFTNDFQLSLTTFLPVIEGTPFVLGIQPKYVVVRSEKTVLAVRGNLIYGNLDGDGIGTFSAGFAFDHYFDPEGRYGVHGGFNVGGAFGTGLGGDDFTLGEGVFFTFDLGLSLAVSDGVKILLEAQLPAASNDQGFDFAPFVFVNYGVRFYGKSLAVDLALIKPVGIDTDPFVIGVPFVAFSARF